jgi:hypothetical protein
MDRAGLLPESLNKPLLSRLYACNAIVNTLTMVMNHDRYAADDARFGSILLRDPTPVVMVEVLSRAGKGIIRLFEDGKFAQSTAQTLIAVVITALKVVSQISTTAGYVLSSLQKSCDEKKLKVRSNSQFTHITAKPNQLSLLTLCDCDFVDEFLQEMRSQSRADSMFLERTIAKHEKIVTT